MSLILRFLLNNIREKKFRTIMLVFSVVFSSALFFSTTAISGTLEKMYVDQMRKYYGSAEIMISANSDSPSMFFNTNLMDSFKNRTEYIIGAVQGTAFYKKSNETYSIQVQGIDLNDLQQMNPINLEQGADVDTFNGRKIIISTKTAKMFNLKQGDAIELDINQTKQKFRICGIAKPVGPFIEFGDEKVGIIPIELASSLYGGNRDVSVAYIKSKVPEEKQQLIKELSTVYKKYTVKETITQKEINDYTSRISMSFTMMLMAVLFMSFFIIYTSFKIITMERLPAIGTLRSIGATKTMTSIFLYLESIFYGVVGGIIGIVLGLGILYLMAIVTAPPYMKGLKVTVVFSGAQMVISFILAVAISLISSYIPIRRISKIPIKEIVLNSYDKYKKDSRVRFVLAFVMIVLALKIPSIAPFKFALVIDTSCVLMLITAVIMLLPLITNMMVTLLQNLYLYIFGNVGSLAAKNLRDNKSILTNISLLVIGISVLLMINSTSTLVIEAATNFYRDMNYNIQVVLDKADRSFESSLLNISGVKSTYGIYQAPNIEMEDYSNRILIRGVNSEKFKDYYNLNISGNYDEICNKLNSKRSILLTNILRKTLGVKEGDTVTLKMKRGKIDYKVIGFFDTLDELGNIALAAEKYIKTDMRLEYYSAINIKTTNDPLEVEGAISEKFETRKPQVSDMKKSEEDTIAANQQLFSVLQFFSIMILIIGLIGVINNLIISFLERKRSFAVLRSIGMSKKQIVKMIFIESLTGGIIGGVFGVVGGIMLISLMPYVLEATGFLVTVEYNVLSYLVYLFFGVVLMVSASVIPVIRSSKLNIIESIKYE